MPIPMTNEEKQEIMRDEYLARVSSNTSLKDCKIVGVRLLKEWNVRGLCNIRREISFHYFVTELLNIKRKPKKEII